MKPMIYDFLTEEHTVILVANATSCIAVHTVVRKFREKSLPSFSNKLYSIRGSENLVEETVYPKIHAICSLVDVFTDVS